MSNPLRKPLELLTDRFPGVPSMWLSLFLSTVLRGKNILLLGGHGSGKTAMAEFITSMMGYEPSAFRCYNAVSDDQISIAGIPLLESIKCHDGDFEFARHKRSIWNAQGIVLIDEITRAPSSTASIYLELLDRKLLGKELGFETLVACANPATKSYSGTLTLDAALQDRFDIILKQPDDLSSDAITQVLRRHFPARKEVVDVSLEVHFLREQLISTRKSFIQDETFTEFLFSEFLPPLRETLLQSEPTEKGYRRRYLSTRSIIRAADSIIDLLSMLYLTSDRPIQKFQDAICFALECTLLPKSGLDESTFHTGLAEHWPSVRQYRDYLEHHSDRLYRLSVGSISDRIQLLRSLLEQDDLTGEEKKRIGLALPDLVTEASSHRSHLSELWSLLQSDEHGHLRQDLEIHALRQRVTELFHPNLESASSPVLRERLKDPAAFHPANPLRISQIV